LPVLPDAKMDTRNEIASLSQVLQQLDARARTAKMMANCRAYVNKRNAVDELKDKLVASELKAVEVADHGRGDAF
jgi:hypothetical protein